MTAKDHGPGIWMPPPLWYAGGLLAGWALGRWFPLPFLPEPMSKVLAVVAFAAGGCVGLSAIGLFWRRRTGILPHTAATTVVAEGPYRFTRNPMYCGMAFLFLGISFFFHWAWALAMLPLVLLVVTRVVIRREEAYLESKFGGQYLEYKRRVRRWL